MARRDPRQSDIGSRTALRYARGIPRHDHHRRDSLRRAAAILHARASRRAHDRARNYPRPHLAGSAGFQSTARRLFHGFVQPSETEHTLNGYRLRTPRTIDWEEQYRGALEAFESNGFFILVGDRQVEALDEEFSVGVETEVQFVKLMPLVGG